MFRRLCALILVGSPALMWGASKEIMELQRDVALLQDQVKQLQQSQDRQLSAMTELVRQALDAANRANTGIAVMQNGFQQSVKDQKNDVVGPVVGLSTRMDSLSNDFRTVQQAVGDLAGAVQKLQAQLTDVGNAVKVLQAPAPAPPGSGSAATGGAPDTPPLPATDLYNNARRDHTGGKLDLAVQEYSDYLKYYGNTDLAPNAQFFIGTIHFSQASYDQALNDFDTVTEKYPDNGKTAEALYEKGLTLLKMSRRTDAYAEFKETIQRFPQSNVAPQACTKIKDLGYHCPTAGSSTGRKKK
ncbi:MAG: tetratricopeptide repeat protein [Bryobacteraceae bacterium]|jgi:TolA-binding protein